LLQAAKDGADLANDQLKHRDLFLKQAEHLFLQGAARNQIEHEHLTVLADAIDAAYALFDRHRVPGDVEIDQGVAELDVAPLSTRLRREQYGCRIAELGCGGVLFGTAEASLKACACNSRLGKAIGEVGERRARVHKDELLFRQVAPDKFEE